MRLTHLAESSKHAKYQPFKFYLLISVIACFPVTYARCTSLIRYVSLPVAGRSDRDGIEDARAQAYHDHADIRENHQRQDQAGYGSFTGPDRR